MADVSRFQRSQPGEASQRAQDVDFPIVLRGYDRQSVDQYVVEMARLLDSLEATQTREMVVQRALDEVGEQTSGILQRAHETAEEITARSRAKAEGRLQRAEREAEMLRRDADEYAERLVADTRVLWEERQRLIDEMRQLADEVLGTADDAAERLSEPEMLRRRPPEPDPEDDALGESTTVMPALNRDAADSPFDLAEQDPGSVAGEPEAPAFDDAPDPEPAPDGEQPTQEVEVPWLAGEDPERHEADETLPLHAEGDGQPLDETLPLHAEGDGQPLDEGDRQAGSGDDAEPPPAERA